MMWLRRILASFNALVLLILLGVLFIFVNYLSSRHYARWDASRQHLTALSEQTRQTLKTVTEPVSVVIFYQPTHRLFEMAGDLLKEYARANPKVSLEFVDPEQDIARAQQLVQELQLSIESPEDLNLIIFRCGTRVKRLTDTDLVEFDYESMGFGAPPRAKAFKGEDAFTSALLSVTQATTPLVWFTTGHGEKSTDFRIT